jgi:hypothetical protein
MSNLINYVQKMAAQCTNIPAAKIDELIVVFNLFAAAFETVQDPHNAAQTLARQEAQTESTGALRHFINRFLRFEPVTDFDRDKMRVPNRDLVRTPHIDVTEVVEFELKLRNIREVLVNFWIKGQTHKAKPLGYDGAVIIWDVLDEPPASPADLTLHTMASKTPHALEFDETQRGKTVYIAAAWQNERGLIGQWSEIQNAVIP